jgi:NAD(P) transhydrogenase subunit alpha
MELVDPIVFRLTIFVLAIFVGYFVVWGVTPALHTPLMAVTNAISSVIVVGALIAVSVAAIPGVTKVSVVVDGNRTVSIAGHGVSEYATPDEVRDRISSAAQETSAADTQRVRNAWTSKGLGFFALILASVNIFGGFLVTSRMLAMYRKKEKPVLAAAGQSK